MEKKYTKPTLFSTHGMNTWIRDIDKGHIQIGNAIIPSITVSAWFTSEPGEKEQLSLGDLSTGIRIRVPFDKLEEVIEEARKARKDKAN